MVDSVKDTCCLLHTKLYRHPLPTDFIPREGLHKLLDQGSRLPLTLVSAPAGYGKSTTVSSWLESCRMPGAWLSLDEGDSDLTLFCKYFIAAVRSLFPNACSRSLTMLRAAELPPMSRLTSNLINDLAEIGEPVVIVLDDYGHIHNPDINELIYQLLKHLLPNLHLMILTRRDPPLSLCALRAKGVMLEIRQSDLYFMGPEIRAFLEKTAGISIDESAVALLQEKTEGWAAGLRMIALSLHNRSDVNEFLREMKGDTRDIKEYLLSEVLSRQSPSVRDGLLKTSILSRYCAPLYSALCHPACVDTCGPECDGQLFMRKLEESNLFCIAMDERHEWFRYHHLFQPLLLRTLEGRYSAEEIAILHDRACAWFEKNGMIEEAFHHAMTGSDLEVAGQLVIRRRHELMNKEQWLRLRNLLDALPRAIIENSPELLMQDAWNLYNQMRIQEMAEVLDRIDSLLKSIVGESAATEEIQAELCCLRSLRYHLVPPCDASRALARAQQSVKGQPLHHSSTRGTAIITLAASYQLTGNLIDAFGSVFEELKHKEGLRNSYHTRLLTALGFTYWVEADLVNLEQTGKQLLELADELHLPESSDTGQYLLGITNYCRNELVEAERCLTEAVRNSSKTNLFNFAHSAFALSLTIQAQGRPDEAGKIAESVVRYALDTGNTPLCRLAHAFKAELSLRQGKLADAVHWMKNHEVEPFAAAPRFYVPQITVARVLLALNTAKSRQLAASLLARLHEFYLSTNNRHCLINVLTLQALLHDAFGEQPAAFERLTEALTRAEPGGLIRNFIDLGPKMADLLKRLTRQTAATGYARRLLDEFGGDNAEPVARMETLPLLPLRISSLARPLTNREIDILLLLAQRLGNKDIAEKLFIAPETVKKHTINIYRKLTVGSRREAVAKAASMGIISSR